ncbi:MAG: hypothetical protein IKG87_00190 [Clostridia bacterium]|nr:hypothetical protein [Clostridia bacterium]MBR3428493.1 hypothetical protein [Clostridia bacterium]
MAYLKGITVKISVKVPIGRDAFNREIFEDAMEDVENVLVAPLSQSSEEILNELSMNGKKARYQLAIPKGDTHSWEDTTVEFFGEKWKTIGFPTIGIEDLIPLDWNRKVVVERYG